MMLQLQLEAAARNEPIPQQPTPMKMLPPRKAPSHKKKNRINPESKENVIPPRSLLNDTWVTNLSNGAELGRVLRLTKDDKGGRTVITTKTAFSISDKNEVIVAGVDVEVGDTIQMS